MNKILIILTSLVFIGLIVFVVLMLRNKCSSGQTYNKTYGKCIPICNPGEKYYPQVDKCLPCSPDAYQASDGTCVEKCAGELKQCDKQCYDDGQFVCGCVKDGKLVTDCTDPQLIDKTRVCADGVTVCASGDSCGADGKCKSCPADRICGGNTCCYEDQKCIDGGCCRISDIHNGKCCTTTWCGDEKTGQCCNPGFGCGKDGKCSKCGDIDNCPQDGHECHQDQQGGYHCKSQTCAWTTPEFNPPNINNQAVCNFTDAGNRDFQLYCSLNGDDTTAKRAVKYKATDPSKCTSDDCALKLEECGLSSSVYDKDGTCSGVFDCKDYKCAGPNVKPPITSALSSPHADDSVNCRAFVNAPPPGVADYQVCKDSQGKSIGKFCASGKGTCIVDGAGHYKCQKYDCTTTGKCGPIDGGNYSSLDECANRAGSCRPDGTRRIHIKKNDKCLGINPQGISSMDACSADNPNQVFYKRDTGKTIGWQNYTGDDFMLLNLEGKCLDGGATVNHDLGNQWKWADCGDGTNSWYHYYMPSNIVGYSGVISDRVAPYSEDPRAFSDVLDSNGDKVAYWSNKRISEDGPNSNQTGWSIEQLDDK